METQGNKILNELEKNGWTIQSKENPQSTSYWWIWEFWIMKKSNHTFVLNFLIDPQCAKKKENVWLVTATKKEPIDRLEAEKGITLGLGRHWKNDLVEFVNSINKISWL